MQNKYHIHLKISNVWIRSIKAAQTDFIEILKLTEFK